MKRILLTLLVAFVLAVAPGYAFAQRTLEEAKVAGMVGEKPDGMLGFVASSVPSDVRVLIDNLNVQRQQRYQEIASRNKTSLSAVQALAGASLIKRTPSGQYVMDAKGQWVKK